MDKVPVVRRGEVTSVVESVGRVSVASSKIVVKSCTILVYAINSDFTGCRIGRQ